jgi:hypothetical protein
VVILAQPFLKRRLPAQPRLLQLGERFGARRRNIALQRPKSGGHCVQSSLEPSDRHYKASIARHEVRLAESIGPFPQVILEDVSSGADLNVEVVLTVTVSQAACYLVVREAGGGKEEAYNALRGDIYQTVWRCVLNSNNPSVRRPANEGRELRGCHSEEGLDET